MVSLFGCEQLTPIATDDRACVPPAVQAAFDRTCAKGGCHDVAGAAAGLVLAAGSSADVLDRDASQRPLPLVTLGDPAQSYMLHKLIATPPEPIVGARMPVGFDARDVGQASDVATIVGWIAGAPFTGCEAAAGSSDEGVADGSSGDAMGDSSGGVIEARGLPCEIDDLLAKQCRSCHDDPPRGAPMPLVTRDDLLADTPSDPTRTVAARALERMRDPKSPMPPAPGTPVADADIALFEGWLADGTPASACGGEDTTTGEPPEPDPFDVDPMCSSGQFWEDDDDGDPRMNPGRDCISCHDLERLDHPGDEDIPDLVIGGTVYPTAHEPNLCLGASSPDLRVVVQSMMTGDEVTLTPNTSGNFLLHRNDAPTGFAAPFTVKVTDGDRERIMPIAAPSGSCNGCHTQDGANGAPGRVVAP